MAGKTGKPYISIVLLVAVVVSILNSGCMALYSSSSPVKALTSSNFDKEVMNSEHTYVVEFFAPWCGHCKQFAPEYSKAAKKLKNFVKVGAVDCDEEKNKPLCGRFGVQGFPTVKIFYTKQKDKKRIWTDYQNERKAKPLMDAALSRMPSFVKPISTSEQIDTKKKLELSRFYNMKNETLPKVILFSEKAKTSDMFKVLAIDFHYKLVFGQVHVDSDSKEDKEFAKSLGAKKFPQLLVIDAKERDGMSEDKPVIKFEGEIKYDSIFKFLSQFATASTKDEDKEEPKPDVNLSKVHNITDIASLESHCLKFNLCLLSFIDSSISKSDVDELKAIIEPLKRESLNMPVAYIDVAYTSTTLTKEFGIDNFPDMAIVSTPKKAFSVFRGVWESQRLLQFVKGVSRGTGARLSTWSGKVEKGAIAKKEGKSEPARDEL